APAFPFWYGGQSIAEAMPNMRPEQQVAAFGFPLGWAANLRRMIMRFGLLGCVAALTLIGAAAAQAETIYVERGYAEPTYVEPGYVTTGAGYIYSEPAPFAAPR